MIILRAFSIELMNVYSPLIFEYVNDKQDTNYEQKPILIAKLLIKCDSPSTKTKKIYMTNRGIYCMIKPERSIILA